MLQHIRDRSQGWIAKTLVGVVVVLLVLTGFNAFFDATGKHDVVAEVNGEEITQAQLNQAMEMQRRQLQQQFGQDLDAFQLDERLLREAALNALIERQLLVQAARDARFAFSEAALDQLILQTPEFQVDGKFDPSRFDQLIRQMGYTRLQFRQLLEEEMLGNQLRAGIAGSNFVTERELQTFASLEKQTRDFAVLTLKAEALKPSVSDEEVRTYYEAHQAEFMTPEQVVAEYVALKKEAFFDQVQVSDEALQALYQREIANLAEQRRAAHILIEVNDKQSDAQARAKIEELKRRLDSGEDFATLAKQFSQDPGSASAGGDLGFAGPGVYDPAFEKALYALQPGQVSGPVRSAYGWHLIKLLGVQAPEVPSFASMKDKLTRELKSQQVEQRFVEAAKRLEDSAFEAVDLAQPAQELGLQVQTTAPFGREGGMAGVTANRRFVQAAFSPEVLEQGANSQVLELDPETLVVLRVKEHQQPRQRPLEQVQAEIRQRLAAEKAADLLRTKGQAILARLRGGQTALEPAEVGQQQWKVVEAATRNQAGIDPAILQAVFRMPKPQAKDQSRYAGLSLPNGDYVLLRLNGVSQSQTPLSDEERNRYAQFLASRLGQRDFAEYRAQLHRDAKIERY